MDGAVFIQQTTIFKRAYKRLHPNQKADVDDAIDNIVSDPTLGEAKKGDLAGVFVYKFKCNGQKRGDSSRLIPSLLTLRFPIGGQSRINAHAKK